MGGLAGATGGRQRRLTRWAFAVDEVSRGDDDRVALVLGPGLIAGLAPLAADGFADGAPEGARSVCRRRVLAALVTRLGLPADCSGGLVVDPPGPRRLGTALYVSMAERAGWAAAVVSRVAVGIDLESVGEARAGAAAVLDGVDIVDPAAWHGLAGVWAAREATLKAMGRDLTSDPRGWRFGNGVVRPGGCPKHRVDLVALPTIVAAVAYAGG